MNIEEHQKILSECHARHDAEVADLKKINKTLHANLRMSEWKKDEVVLLEKIEELEQQLAEVEADRQMQIDMKSKFMRELNDAEDKLIGLSNRVKEECAALCYQQNWDLPGSEMSDLILATKEPE